MENKDFERLTASIVEAGEIRKGVRKAARVTKIDALEVVTVQKNLHMSQRRFAMMMGVSAKTLQNWEQGRRHPVGPAQALLRVVAHNPKAVEESLMSVLEPC